MTGNDAIQQAREAVLKSATADWVASLTALPKDYEFPDFKRADAAIANLIAVVERETRDAQAAEIARLKEAAVRADLDAVDSLTQLYAEIARLKAELDAANVIIADVTVEADQARAERDAVKRLADERDSALAIQGEHAIRLRTERDALARQLDELIKHCCSTCGRPGIQAPT